jgi:phosphate starvation-inducible PhoH-like protein
MLTNIKMVAGPSGVGKQLTLDTPVLTPNGWILNKDLEIGDYVISQDGKATKVLEIYDNLDLNTYELLFSDNTSVECCDEHLWLVQTRKDIDKNKNRVISLGQMLDNINKTVSAKNGHYYSIPLCELIEFKV